MNYNLKIVSAYKGMMEYIAAVRSAESPVESHAEGPAESPDLAKL